jgi:hypothetical protein
MDITSIVAGCTAVTDIHRLFKPKEFFRRRTNAALCLWAVYVVP